MRVRVLSGGLDFLARCSWPANGDVVANGVIEKHGLLCDHRDLVAQVCRFHIANVCPANFHLPFRRVIESQQEAGQSRFSRTGASNQSDELSRLNRQLDIAQNRLVAVIEAYSRKMNWGSGCLQRLRILGFEHLRPCIEQLKDAASGGAGLHDLILEPNDGFQWPVHGEDRKHKQEKIARVRSVAESHGIKQQHRYADRTREFDQRSRNFARTDQSHVMRQHRCGRLPEAAADRVLQIIGLDDSITRKRLMHDPREHRVFGLNLRAGSPNLAAINNDRHQANRKNDQSQQSQSRLHIDQPECKTDERHRFLDHYDQRITENILQGKNITNPRHQFAGAVLAEKTHWQIHQVLE